MAIDLLRYMEQARAEFPAALLSKDEVAHCLYRAAQLAQADGFDVGVLLKPNGTGGMSPIGRISLDIIIDIPDQQEYDGIAKADADDGGPGPAIPVWHKLPFKVGKCAIVNGKEECSGASMDRVKRPAVVIIPAPTPPPTPDPEPPNPPPPTYPPVSDGLLVQILEELEVLRAELKTRDDTIIAALARLENDNRKSRPVTVSGGWLGTLKGTVGGVKG